MCGIISPVGIRRFPALIDSLTRLNAAAMISAGIAALVGGKIIAVDSVIVHGAIGPRR